MPHITDIIKKLSTPLDPVDTGTAPRLPKLPRIRAVAFDIYGTLLISGTGDVGAHDETRHLEAMRDTLSAAGINAHGHEQKIEQILHEEISADQARMRDQGTDFPEIEIREIWRNVLQRISDMQICTPEPSSDFIETIAVDYECRTNPVWLMPYMAETLELLKQSGLILAIVSNAQFYTPLIIEALCEKSTAALGFASLDCVWSYQLRHGKPSTLLYETLAERLYQRHNISPEETLFVGNDMLKDVWASAQCGFKTALFAGDKRSLRLREDSEKCRGLRPDAVVTDLRQIPGIVIPDHPLP